MSIPLRHLRTLLCASCAALLAALGGCATAPPTATSTAAPSSATPSTTRVFSHGPVYAGERPVSRLYVYFFIDIRPEYMTDTFREEVGFRLKAALEKSGIPSSCLWFSETPRGKAMQANIKSQTFYDSVGVQVGSTIRDNIQQDRALAPSHRLIVFPSQTYRSGAGAVFNVKWDVIDTRTGYYEWPVNTQTTALSSSMNPLQAEATAARFVEAIVEELQARAVIPRGKGWAPPQPN